ncbi:uncharacterized protein [Rutidosis leptorrhynchoides]|uniref:uncharacterized protein n=1 Tax=Rutidosis leptorrhynchoides TaxID=125765 RepID=UPI003A98EB1E
METSFWNEPWCGGVCFRTAFPRLYRLDLNKNCLVAERVKWTEDSVEFNWEWSGDPKWRAVSELTNLTEKLSNYVPPGKIKDEWKWMYHNSGIFSTKSLTKIIGEVSVASRATTEPTILNPFLPQKVSIFIWRASQNKLPVRTELDKRGVDLHSTRCPVCDDDIETLHHSIISCKVAKDVWEKIQKWWRLDHLLINDISDLSKATNPKFKNPLVASIWQAVVWVSSYFLWKNRNDHVFGNKPPSPSKILADIQSRSFEWINCRAKKVCIEWLSWFTDPLASVLSANSREGIG